MGASAWSYVTPHTDDPQAMLDRLHGEELASGDFYWGDDDIPRPTTIEQLWAVFEQDEGLATDGTHSILDIWRVAPPGVKPDNPDVSGTLFALNDDEVLRMFGTDRPTRELFASMDPAMHHHDADPVLRWNGCYTPLYDGGAAAAFGVWGVTGD